ncbi:ABC transporter permease [Actinokineospora sp. HUAS TT18]|uniref:ABC transporter permease n=1 Tax=Actinokineospora sp. HUAS TT18 TaxID=3447451 RepID=UPI003F5246DF
MSRAPWALMVAGFRRYATYRQATVAGIFTNSVFGFLRCYVLLAVAAGGTVAGYSGPQLITYVWLGQGMLAVVNTWTTLELAEQVRSGDIVADLLRPMDPLWTYLWTDLGRAGFSLLTRFSVPLLVGALAFGLYVPEHAATYALTALSIVLAVVVGFACRYLVGLTSFWLLDVRGVQMFWTFASGAGSGLYFPLAILPDWLTAVLWFGTPFPSLLQAPLDVAVERGGFGHVAAVIGGQVVWAVVLLLACRVVQARAVAKLVVQGG